MKLMELTEAQDVKMPHPQELETIDERGGIKAISWSQVIDYFNRYQHYGDPAEYAQQWLKRAGNLMSVYQSNGRPSMQSAYEQAKQEGKQFVVVV